MGCKSSKNKLEEDNILDNNYKLVSTLHTYNVIITKCIVCQYNNSPAVLMLNEDDLTLTIGSNVERILYINIESWEYSRRSLDIICRIHCNIKNKIFYNLSVSDGYLISSKLNEICKNLITFYRDI